LTAHMNIPHNTHSYTETWNSWRLVSWQEHGALF